MSRSELVDFIKISPNSNNPRKYPVTKITIHHTASVATVEGLGRVFASPARQASSNYGIGSDGRVGLYVEEGNRAWTSSNRENDERAVTIEVSNSKKGGDWPVSDKVFDKLVALCVDICRRNGIEKLEYTGDAEGNLTRHNMFAATACPGPYLQSRFPLIAELVNEQLKPTGTYYVTAGPYESHAAAQKAAQLLLDAGHSAVIQDRAQADGELPAPQVGETVYFLGGLQYSNANAPQGETRPAGEAKLTKVAPGKLHPYHLVKTGAAGPYGWVDEGSFV